MLVRMRTYFSKQEAGQVLIQVAVMIVVLLGFVSLAIDVGNVYSERRRMQNAADAGALAGARELCLLSPEDVAIAKAKEYMTKNGVAAGDIAAGDVTVTGGNVVDTTAKKTANTFFAGLVGFPSFPVGAGAAAACGAATSACGLWPIAFDRGLWDENLACGEKFVMWQSGDGDDLACVIDGKEHPPCDCYNCNLDGIGGDDFRIVTETSRGWLDYSSIAENPYVDTCAAGCGTSELVCRVESNSATKITLPACVPGIRGVRMATGKAIEDRIGDAISIPLFESTGCPTDSNCKGTDADSFYVTKFACVTVEAWYKKNDFKLDPKPSYLLINPKAKTVKSAVAVVSRRCDGACTTSCGSTDGTAPEPWEVTAVSLTK